MRQRRIIWLIVEFGGFERDAEELLSADELDDVRLLLAFHPESGVVIPGTGGVRKLRVGLEAKGKGKRGGARVVFCYHSDRLPLALLTLYAKG